MFRPTPAISVVVSSYNKGRYLPDTIQSVLKQTLTDLELIIVDDHSTDKSIHLIEKFAAIDDRIKFKLNQKNKGANHCRNEGIKMANGEYLVFLDADDILAKDCLVKRVETIKKSDDFDFCVFSMGIFREFPGDLRGDWIPNSTNPLPDFLSHKLPWALPQPIWKTDFLLRIGGLDESFTRLQDVELHTKALLTQGVNFFQVGGTPDCYYRIADDRANFESFELLSRYVHSATLYYSKFFPLLTKRKLRSKLLGTIYRIYTRILNSYRMHKISAIQLQRLERQLLDPSIIFAINGYKRVFFSAGKAAAQLPLRIPGVNWTLAHLVEL